MPYFPSLEWAQAYADRLAGHQHAGATAAALDGVYRFVVSGNQEFAFEFAVAPDSDGGAQVTAHPAGEAGREPRLVVTASRSRWLDLISGKSDFVLAYLMRRVRIDGDLGLIRSRLEDAKPLLDALHAVPTTS